jgi:hypothetical protein
MRAKPHLLLDAAEMDGEAELVVLHRRAGDGLRLDRQSAVHLEISRENSQVRRQTNPVACWMRARNRSVVRRFVWQYYLLDYRQEVARWLPENSFSLTTTKTTDG